MLVYQRVCEILNILLPSFAGSISQSSEKHVCSRHGSGFAAFEQRYSYPFTRREHGHHETRQAVTSILEMRSSRRILHYLIARIEQLRTHDRTKTERQICDAWRTRTCVARGRKQTQGMRDRITQVKKPRYVNTHLRTGIWWWFSLLSPIVNVVMVSKSNWAFIWSSASY